MASLNKVMIIGRLGKDPEGKTLPGGTYVCNFSVATSEKYTNKSTGEKNEKTEWHNCVAFGKTGEVCARYLKKGSEVYVEGKIETQTWDDKEGVKRHKTQINVTNVVFLSGNGDKSAATPSAPPPAGNKEQPESDDLPF